MQKKNNSDRGEGKKMESLKKGDKGFCDKNREKAGMGREEAKRERELEQ